MTLLDASCPYNIAVEISESTAAFVRAHRTENVRDLALHAKREDGLDLMWALDQIAGWQTARTKLPQWADSDGIIYPPHISMEQCSSEATARYKARLASTLLHGDCDDYHPTGSLIDLTGGFGVDCSYMARVFAQTTYVERQADLCAIARHNMAALDLGSITVVHADAEEYLKSAEPVDIIFLDPARRSAHGARTYAIADCTPNVLAMQDCLTAKARYVIVKLSPMLDWHKAVADFRGAVREVHIVAVANECKELLMVLEGASTSAAPVSTEAIPVSCVTIDASGRACVITVQHGRVMSVEGESGAASPQENIASASVGAGTIDLNTDDATRERSFRPQYLYEPNAAIMKAGCFDAIATAYGVEQLGRNSHVFYGATPIADFPGRAFHIEAVTTMSKKDVKRSLGDLTQANITVRNFPLSVDQLRKKLHLKDGGDTYLFATTDRDNRHIIIRAVRLT